MELYEALGDIYFYYNMKKPKCSSVRPSGQPPVFYPVVHVYKELSKGLKKALRNIKLNEGYYFYD